MSTFSLFEFSLLFLFKHIQTTKGEAITMKWDWQIKTIVEKYQSILGFDLKLNSHWAILEHYKEIRNAITHRNCTIHLAAGEILESNKTYHSLKELNEYTVLFKPDNYFRIVRKEFIIDFISTVNKFYHELTAPVQVLIGTPDEELKRTIEKSFNS